MKLTAIALGSALALSAAAAASAQVYYDRSYDPYYQRNASQECWNPRAGHFEQVRPGEYQGDLDMGRCRMTGERYYDRSWDHRREAREECWNPRARHYEEVRRGERQDDLDFSRCRIYR